MKYPRSVPILLGLTLLVGPGDPAVRGALAQTAPQSEETFYETVEVNVVNVEVFVTDRDGQRVRGLSRNDFEILEDGQPVEITNFYASDAGSAAAAATTGEAAAAETLVPDEQRLLLAIFVDNSNLSSQARNRVLPQIEEFLSTRLRPEDRVVLSSYDGLGSLKIRQVPTGDPKAVVAGLKELSRVAGGVQSGGAAELRELVMALELSPNPSSANVDELRAAEDEARAILDRIRVYAQQERDKVKAMVGTLGQFVDGLAGVPGRKAVLLVSGGTSLRPAQALYDAWNNRFGRMNDEADLGGSRLDAFDVDVGTELEKVGTRANANRVTFYAMGTTDSMSVDSVATYGNEIWTRNQDMVQASNMGQSLLKMVAPTGGMASLDTVNPGAVLGQLEEDMSSFYSLGYTPSHRRSGRSHKIGVRVKRPGFKVRHRESYRDRSSAEVMTDKVMAALMFGSRENPLEVGLQFGEELADKGKSTVLVTVKLPMSKLVLLPQGEFHEGRVTIFLAARDADGRNSPITQVKVPIRVPNEQLLTAMGQLAGYRTKLALRRTDHTVAVGVRDELGNMISTVTAAYTPGGAPAAASRVGRAAEPGGDRVGELRNE